MVASLEPYCGQIVQAGIAVMTDPLWTAIGGVFVTAIGSAVVATWRVGAIRAEVADKIINITEKFDLKLEAVSERESKSRHDLRNEITILMGKIEKDLRDTDQRHALLSQDAIRKGDLSAFEARMTAERAASETRITGAIEKLGAKMEEMRQDITALQIQRSTG